MRVVHLSDIHLSTFDGAKPSDFFNKRALGGLNLLLNRRAYRGEAQAKKLDALRRDIEALAPDHIVVTGDLTSLSLPAEFALAREFVASLGGPGKVSLIPGNHDAYLHHTSTAGHFDEVFAEYHDSIPYARPLGEHAVLIGVSSAVPTWLLGASGAIGEEQQRKIEALLLDPAHRGKLLVVAMHHPPEPRLQKNGGRLRALKDAAAAQSIFARAKVGIILHGHEHSGLRYEISDGRGWRADVYDAGSATSGHHARYNVYTFAKDRPALLEVEARHYDAASERFHGIGAPPVHPKQHKAPRWAHALQQPKAH